MSNEAKIAWVSVLGLSSDGLCQRREEACGLSFSRETSGYVDVTTANILNPYMFRQ